MNDGVCSKRTLCCAVEFLRHGVGKGGGGTFGLIQTVLRGSWV